MFRDWAEEILQAMQPLVALLAEQTQDSDYVESLLQQQKKVQQPDLTPSGRMLREMRENGEGFYQFARRLSQEQWRYFSDLQLDEYFRDHMQELGRQSLQQQQQLEADSSESLDAFLQRYFSRQI